MAITGTQFTVGSTPVKVFDWPMDKPSPQSSSGDYNNVRVTLFNRSLIKTVTYLGPSDMGSSGAGWDGSQPLYLELEPGEALYARVASGAQSIDVLASGR